MTTCLIRELLLIDCRHRGRTSIEIVIPPEIPQRRTPKFPDGGMHFSSDQEILTAHSRPRAHIENAGTGTTGTTSVKAKKAYCSKAKLVVYAAKRCSGRARAPEVTDRIEQLVGSLLTSYYRNDKKKTAKESVISTTKILLTSPRNLRVNRPQQRLKGREQRISIVMDSTGVVIGITNSLAEAELNNRLYGISNKKKEDAIR